MHAPEQAAVVRVVADPYVPAGQSVHAEVVDVIPSAMLYAPIGQTPPVPPPVAVVAPPGQKYPALHLLGKVMHVPTSVAPFAHTEPKGQ